MNPSKARDELEELVLSNISRIDLERVKEMAPKLRAADDEDLLREFVRTTHPGDVLLYCFYEYDLQILAVDQLAIRKERNLRGRELAGEILEWCGFPKEVKPTGLFQIRDELNPILKSAEEFHLPTQESIGGFCLTMARAMEQLLPQLFLFHIGILRRETENKETIEKLCRRYQKGRKSLGCYIGFMSPRDQGKPEDKDGYLTVLINIVQNDNKLKNYYQRYFQCEVPLTRSHIAELGMFVIYRNLMAHDWDCGRWPANREDAETNLSNMNETAQENWGGNWNSIVDSVKSQPQHPILPKREMLQKMAVFFRKFLDLLSENQIYPKVIVMVSSTVDNYGTHQISVESSDPNDETLFLTDCDFIPHTQFYYHSRTNPTSIDPILVSKEELEDWATQSDDDTEN